MLPKSHPIIPPVPAETTYGVDRLYLFPTGLTRATFRARHNVQAPPWDRARRIQRWYDTSILEHFEGDPHRETVTYQVFDSASGAVRPMVMTVAEASTPNLPGAYDYPKYQPQPTPAHLVDPFGQVVNQINPIVLSEHSEALALGSHLGLPASAIMLSEIGGYAIRWNGETRRPWLLQIGPNLHSVGLLLQTRHAQGKDAPGRWELQGGVTPVWVSEIPLDTGEQDLRPEIPLPMRQLQPAESAVRTLTGWMIRRTIPQQDPAEILREILDISRQLLTLAQAQK